MTSSRAYSAYSQLGAGACGATTSLMHQIFAPNFKVVLSVLVYPPRVLCRSSCSHTVSCCSCSVLTTTCSGTRLQTTVVPLPTTHCGSSRPATMMVSDDSKQHMKVAVLLFSVGRLSNSKFIYFILFIMVMAGLGQTCLIGNRQPACSQPAGAYGSAVLVR